MVGPVLNLGVAGYDARAMMRTVGAAQDLLALLGAMADPKAMGVRMRGRPAACRLVPASRFWPAC